MVPDRYPMGMERRGYGKAPDGISSKAHEDGERYALRTATRAAESIQCHPEA